MTAELRLALVVVGLLLVALGALVILAGKP